MLQFLLPAFLVYLLWVRRARYERINTFLRAYAERHNLATIPPLERPKNKDGSTTAPTRAEYPMTPAEAQTIVRMDGGLEFPFGVEKSLEFALFKTYGIESISKLLKATGELGKSELAGRRYVDTVVLINSWIAYPLLGPGSGALVDNTDGEEQLDPRSAVAIARLNYIHGKYKGKISNDDFLYTLSVFVLGPPEWAEEYEWRAFIPLEQQATFVFWSEIGRRMGIDNIPLELQELTDWSKEYEIANMLPSKICQDVAAPTVDLLLYNTPSFLHPFGKLAVSALLDDRLRAAVMAPAVPLVLTTILKAAIVFRGLVIKHLFLPRSIPTFVLADQWASPAFPPTRPPTAEDESTIYAPRSFVERYNNEPWYHPLLTTSPSIFGRLLALLPTFSAQAPSVAFRPEGFRLEEVGPVAYELAGHEEVRREAERILGARVLGPYAIGGMRGCPMGFGGK